MPEAEKNTRKGESINIFNLPASFLCQIPTRFAVPDFLHRALESLPAVSVLRHWV